MTIKRRLFISNIIMLIFQLVLATILFFAIQFILVGDDTQRRGGFGGRFTDMPSIPIVGASQAEEALTRGDFSFITSDARLYHSDLGDFIIIAPDQYRYALEDFLADPNFVLPLAAVFLPLIVVLANVLLARYISKKIMKPINTLANGVNEISLGNLTHRIQHTMGDEFDAVCEDFNQMAARLQDMVEKSQADESSRKELIAGISHDLRTPLTSIKAYIEGLRAGIATTPQMQERYLDTIHSKTEDIEYIIKQLFIFSKIDIGEFPLDLKVVDVGDMLAEMVESVSCEYKEMGLEVTLEESAHANVKIDIVQFKNILENVLGNSLKYSNVDDPCVKIYCKKDASDVVIKIEDNGIGVADEMLSKIFDVFYRGDEARNNPSAGSGLGLAISSKIIGRFGGSVRAENVPSGGLAIIITLPTYGG